MQRCTYRVGMPVKTATDDVSQRLDGMQSHLLLGLSISDDSHVGWVDMTARQMNH
jgi:hypothetical protein